MHTEAWKSSMSAVFGLRPKRARDQIAEVTAKLRSLEDAERETR